MTSASLPLDSDAAIVLGIASTAMAFARTEDGQAERWLRVLRLHGEAGVALCSLGVSEQPLEPTTEDLEGPANPNPDPVANVSAEAGRIAAHRGGECVVTTDVLRAVMKVYGAPFDRVLEAHGTDRGEVEARLGPRPGVS